MRHTIAALRRGIDVGMTHIVRYEFQEQREFMRLQSNIYAVDARFSCGFVDLQAAELQQRGRRVNRRSAAPQYRTHARNHLTC